MTRSRIVLVAVAVVVALGSCSGDGSPESADGGGGQQTLPPTSATTEAPATTATTLDEQEVAEEALDAELRAAYERYWETTAALFAAPDPTDPRLAEVATGPSLTLIRDTLATRQVEGVTSSPPPNSVATREIMSVEWEGRGDPDTDAATVTEAVVESCFVSDTVVYDAAGAVRSDGVVTARWTQTLVLEGGVWKVSESDVGDQMGLSSYFRGSLTVP